MADVAKLEAALLKAHNAGDTRAAQAIANEIKRVRSAAPSAPPRTKGTGIGPLDTALGYLNEALVGGAEGITNVGAAITDPLVGLIYGGETKNKMQQQRRAGFEAASRALSTQPMSVARGAGRLAGETAASAPIIGAAGAGLIGAGGRLATVAPRAGRVVQNVGRATATGGIGSGRTAAQTAAMTRTARAADLATRIAGGAVAGGVGAAATGQDIREGAKYGAATPVVAGAARKAAGWLADMFRGDKIRAANMFREALGTDIDAAKAAFQRLGPDDQRLARKVLIDEGIEPDTFMALGASVERLHPEQVRKITEAETAAARRGLEEAAGVAPGASVTDTRAAVRGGRKAVSAAMSPVREEAFSKIKDINREVSDAERLAVAARAEADRLTETGIVPRMRGLEGRSLEQLDAVFQNPEMFTTGRTVQRIGEIAGQAGARADAGIERQLGLRQQALDMEDFIHQAAAADVKPQRAAPLVEELRRMAAREGTRMEDLQRNTILRVARKIEGAMDANGMVNPYDMYQLRKTGVSDIIEGFQKKITAGTEPRSGNVRRAEELAGTVRSMIDDMLGPEFKDYLARSAEGYKFVNRQELAGEALKRFKEPGGEGFLKLARGDDPKAVAKIMKGGPDQESIGNALTAQMSIPFTEAAGLLNARNRMAELAASGGARAAELMARETPSKSRAVARMALSTMPAGRIAVEGAEQLMSDLMRPKIREQLAQGFLSGQNANALLETYPRSMLTDEQVSQLSPYTRNLLAQSLRNYFMSSPAPDTTSGY